MRDKFYTIPPDYKNFAKKIDRLKEKFEFINVIKVGESTLGRDILAVGIGELECVNLYVGGVHASEWITSTLLIRFIEDVCSSIKQGKEFKGVNFSRNSPKGMLLVPMLNPDGVEIALGGYKSAMHLGDKVKSIIDTSILLWQANANGVDLNRNFDAGFDYCKSYAEKIGVNLPSPRYYPGEYACDQAETKVLVKLCEKYNINCAYAFHTQGEEIFYEYMAHTPKISFHIASLIASYCGYSLVKQTEVCAHGGFKDWFIKTYHKPAFTIEVGKGENPLPITDLEEIYIKLVDALCVSAVI